MVLVAAIAASVLLNVAGILQQKASTTGKETTKQVSSNLFATSVVGDVDSSSRTIDNLTITIRAGAGSGRIDLKNMLISIDNNNVLYKLAYNSTCTGLNNATSNKCYNMTAKVDPNGVFRVGSPVIDPNAIVDVEIKNLSANLELGNRGVLRITMMPEVGTVVALEIKIPDTFTGTVVPLYP